MTPPLRREQFATLFPAEPAFRWTQAEQALFDGKSKQWSDVKGLPKSVQEIADKEIPWMTVKADAVVNNARRDTYKAALEVSGGGKIESVLMQNRRGQWTICVSSQVGCAMRCTFCATGKMGLTRNLTADEIVDQYRFWNNFLRDSATQPLSAKGGSASGGNDSTTPRISNVVYMGMGEPLANYENVRESLNVLLKQTDLGETRITVSTVGVLPRLEQILTDKAWPHVKLAVSLHSADPVTRKDIVPTSYDQFLPTLEDWSRRYLRLLGNRRHHLTFEYVMLKDINDTEHHAKVLAAFVHKIGDVKVNLIPYNFTDSEFECSSNERIAAFLAILEAGSIVSTRRRTMGDDIAAACGQLIVLNKKS